MLHAVDQIMFGLAIFEIVFVFYLRHKRKQYRVVVKKQMEQQCLFTTQIIEREDVE